MMNSNILLLLVLVMDITINGKSYKLLFKLNVKKNLIQKCLIFSERTDYVMSVIIGDWLPLVLPKSDVFLSFNEVVYFNRMIPN